VVRRIVLTYKSGPHFKKVGETLHYGYPYTTQPLNSLSHHNQTLLHISVIGVIGMALHTGRILPARMRKRKYNPACFEDEVSISDILREGLNIASGDELSLENEVKSASEESSNTSPESECESEICVVYIDGWEDVTMGDKKLESIHIY
jgi:hypothetical protein